MLNPPSPSGRTRSPRGRSSGRVAAALPIGALAAVAAALAPAPALAASDPPPGRAYEIVSPVLDPSGTPAGVSSDFMPMPARASEDGDRLIYGTTSVPGATWSGPANPMVFGHRTPTGWVARNAIRSVDYGDTALELSAHEAQSGWLTSDGATFVTGIGRNLGSASSAAILPSVYRTTDADAPPDWLSRPNVGGALPGVSPSSVSAADDARTVVFSSRAPLTGDAPPNGTSAVYVRSGGELRLVSRLPDGSVSSQSAWLANIGVADLNAGRPAAISMRNQLAGNGRFVLFMADVENDGWSSRLYVRDLENGVTHQLAGGGSGTATLASPLETAWGGAGQVVSPGVRTVPPGLTYGAASAPVAFFNPKRADASVDPGVLHEADLETGVVTPRSAITGPPLGLSADGRRMIFIAPTPTSGVSGAGAWTLRFWDAADPETSVAIGTVSTTSGNPTYGLARVYRSSADGGTWIFTAAGSLDPARPNVGPLTQQLYRWSVGEASPTCLSCEPTDGVARTSGVSLTPQESISSETFVAPTTPIPFTNNAHKVKIAQKGHSVSSDGRWLLFDSPDRLVAEDVNDVRDVYLWDRDAAAGGGLELVTRGVGNSPAYALDLDPTGRNAFFSTRDALVPADTDGAYDVYTARIGGGFPNAPDLSCAGEGCRPAVGGPAGPVAGSVLFAGRGNAEAPARAASVRVSRLKAVVGRVARLRVRVPGAGRVSVAGRSIRNAGKSTKRSATYTVRVALKPRARKALANRKRGRLRVAVRVVYRSASGQRASRRVRITFKQPKQSMRAGRKGGR
jgi:hypothetical protein